jgi:thioredoxin-like negative regulator of GroEL
MTTMTMPPWRAAIGAAVLMVSPAFADGISWRTDYTKALGEAAESRRLVLLDFGTQACTCCRKLDATTFRNAEVIRLVNDNFIAVKIDAEREPDLARTMHVDSYPTLIVAGADRKVLGTQVGYVDAAGMTAFVNKLVKRLPAVQTVKVEADGISRCHVSWSTGRTTTAASTLLHQARRDLDEGQFASCRSRCDRITRDFADAPEAEAARRLAEQARTAASEEASVLSASLQPLPSR